MNLDHLESRSLTKENRARRDGDTDVGVDNPRIGRRGHGEAVAYKLIVDQPSDFECFSGTLHPDYSDARNDIHISQHASTVCENDEFESGNIESDIEKEGDWHNKPESTQYHPTKYSEAMVIEVR